jgi:Protein of unknown function (DUF1761)
MDLVLTYFTNKFIIELLIKIYIIHMTINYLLILAVAVLQTIIGAFWYSPLLFGKFWMKVNGIPENITKEEMKARSKGVGSLYAIQFLLTLLTDALLYIIVASMGWSAGIGAALICVGFMIPMIIQNELWTTSDKSMKIKKILVVGGQVLISIVVAGVIFGLVR